MDRGRDRIKMTRNATSEWASTTKNHIRDTNNYYSSEPEELNTDTDSDTDPERVT